MQLSIDLRLQRMVEEELVRAVQKFSAIGAQSIVMDVTNGEILAMASLPTYDANNARTITNEALFNRATLGVYEQGSMFKVFNTALALDSGKFTMTDDVRRERADQDRPLHHPRRSRRAAPRAEPARGLHLFVEHRLGQDGGRGRHRDAARLLRQDRLPEAAADPAPELGTPLYPRHWAKINTMTIAFGHGISVTPLHLTTGVAAMVNGGILYPPTLREAQRDEPIPAAA